jgi:hypothetical protein
MFCPAVVNFLFSNYAQGLFNRFQESQPSDTEKDDRIKTDTKAPESKALPTPASNGQNGSFNTHGSVTDKELPAMPALDSQPTGEAAGVPRDPRRASMPLPPIASPNALLSGRFYSQMSTDTPSSAQHTRVKSQPLMTAPPLSPIAPSDSNKSISQSSHLHTSDGRASQELHAEEARPSQDGSPEPFQSQGNQQEQGSTIGPSLSVKSRKRAADQSESANTEAIAPKNITVSSDSSFSNHPHRESEVRALNEPAEPVELAITKDDSSEEIVMSPTAYPGQEWSPMHY